MFKFDRHADVLFAQLYRLSCKPDEAYIVEVGGAQGVSASYSASSRAVQVMVSFQPSS